MKAAKKVIPAGYRISLYIRASTEELSSNPEGTLKNQEERLRQAVKFKNMEGNFGDIVAVYVDRAKSGKDTNRPELQKLLNSIRKRETDLVMVSELSRISRSIKDFSEIWELMQANKCGFYSLRENFDTTTAAGEMVLFTVANIAQFERRQVAERVSANFNARSQRGLFNGGSIPVGYKKIQDKPGYLEIDEEAAETVRVAFKTFIREGALMAACKWLNEQKIRLKKKRDAGGKERLGFFTVDNLQGMLRNRMYIGVRFYKQKGEIKEAEAVWPPIIDRATFDEANALLTKNKSCNKNAMESRYPYILSGFVSCKVCGDRFLGKSAHGKYEKYGYYEHAWNTKKGSYVPNLKHRCEPNRIRATDIEPIVWNSIVELLTSEKVAAELLSESMKSHRRNPGSKEAEKCRQVIFSVEQQLETLAERLATLPKTISPTPIFKQMEKLEGIKTEAQSKLTQLDQAGSTMDAPAELKDYGLFLAILRDILRGSDCPKTKTYIVRQMVKGIQVSPEAVFINFMTGTGYVQQFLLRETEQADDSKGDCSDPENKKGVNENFGKPDFFVNPQTLSPEGVKSSNSLTFGRPKPILSEPLQLSDMIKVNFHVEQDNSKECVALYGKGMSLRDIGKELNISKTKVRSNLLKAGAELRPKDPTPVEVSRWRIRKTKSPPPFGYCYFQGELVKNPIEYDVLLKIHRQWKEGRDANEITRYLNAKKLKPRKAMAWHNKAVKKIVARFESKKIVIKGSGI